MLGLVFLTQAYGHADMNFAELALGEATAGYWAELESTPIHCEGFPTALDLAKAKPVAHIDDCIEGSMARRADHVVLLLGNSQMHSINQFNPGDVTIPPLLHPRLAQTGRDLLTVSYPNGNQQEHLVSYAYASSRLPLKTIVLNLVFDDFREEGVRPRLQPALNDTGAQLTLQSSEIGRQLIDQATPATHAPSATTPQSLQDRSETALNDWLRPRSNFWSNRAQARSGMLTALYKLRNSAFNITPQSKRSVIPGRYAANRAAVAALLAHATARGARVLAYIAPLRDDVEPPYDSRAYADFISDMRVLLAEGGGEFRNFSDLVPAEFWGMKDGTNVDGELELDFMHFQAPGHALVADSLFEFIENGQAPR